MDRPYIICHMVMSLDGKVTGDFLFRKECAAATDIYYRLNRELASDGFICGRVTMEGSFTGGFYPDLSRYERTPQKNDFIAKGLDSFYAVAFDTHGRLGWQSNRIVDPDGDPGYDGAKIVEVLSEDVDERYLTYLQTMGISYLFAGKDSIDVGLALSKLKSMIGCRTLLLEGGSILNGAFERVGAVDEISLVVAPAVADRDDKPLFMNSDLAHFELIKAEKENESLILNYRKKQKE